MEIKTSDDFLKLIDDWAIRYLAAGDIAYTNIGSDLSEMFKRFNHDENQLIQDFAKWVMTTSKGE